MKRIDALMVGGMVSSTMLTLVVIPAVYALWRRRQAAESMLHVTVAGPVAAGAEAKRPDPLNWYRTFVVCPLVPGETTAKLRRLARRTEPNGAGRPDRPPSDWGRRSACAGVRCARTPGTAPGHEDAKGWCTSTRSDPRRYREPVPLGSHPPHR